MDTVIAVCLALIVLELGIILVIFAVAMLRVKDAARAVETAAYRIDQEVHSFGESMRSGWFQLFKGLLSAAVRFFRPS